MKTAIYIHGLGGSGSGSSAKNVKKALSSLSDTNKAFKNLFGGEEFSFSAGTYDLLKPEQAFPQIQADMKKADLVIASSLGAFYASCALWDDAFSGAQCNSVAGGDSGAGDFAGTTGATKNTRILLLNPCLEPENTIKNILYPEQKKDFDEEKCHSAWKTLKENWKKLPAEKRGLRFGVFSDRDELFSFRPLFIANFGTSAPNQENSVMISGTHEIAKSEEQLSSALNAFLKYCSDC